MQGVLPTLSVKVYLPMIYGETLLQSTSKSVGWTVLVRRCVSPWSGTNGTAGCDCTVGQSQKLYVKSAGSTQKKNGRKKANGNITVEMNINGTYSRDSCRL